MNYKELIKKQKELDEEEFICPKCGEKEKWGFYKDWACIKEFENRTIITLKETGMDATKDNIYDAIGRPDLKPKK